MTIVAGIRIYPVKSCGGIDVETALVEPRGLARDRRYMIVDANDRFVTQRQHARMALIRIEMDPTGLTLSAPGQSLLRVADGEVFGDETRVRIWRGACDAVVAPAHINAWLSGYLGFACRLVRMNDEHHRAVPNDAAQFEDEVSFADGAPLLLASLDSLDDLNTRLAKAVGIERFRPNVIIEGAPAFAEDSWQRIRIGSAELSVAWPCARCTMITIDPATAEPDPEGEPLATLKTFRRAGRGVMFGQNLIPRRFGRVSVGDRVEPLS
jgi:MOSC domain-containing protein